MPVTPIRLLIVGAHPDDAEYHAGGTAALFRAAGHVVKMVSLTDGSAGHQTMRGAELARRRRAEAAAAASIIDADFEVLDNPDGCLLPTLECRAQVIRLIRTFRPDLLLTHRPNEYHPDHRSTSLLVQDAAYLVTVPAICPEAAALAADPVIAYLSDDFQKPTPFRPDVVVDVSRVVDRITAMLDCHESQFYEWLPYHAGRLQEVPTDRESRRQWLSGQVLERLRAQAARHRSAIVRAWGPGRAAQIECLEAFELCEYGARLDDDARRRLFGFLYD